MRISAVSRFWLFGVAAACSVGGIAIQNGRADQYPETAVASINDIETPFQFVCRDRLAEIDPKSLAKADWHLIDLMVVVGDSVCVERYYGFSHSEFQSGYRQVHPSSLAKPARDLNVKSRVYDQLIFFPVRNMVEQERLNANTGSSALAEHLKTAIRDATLSLREDAGVGAADTGRQRFACILVKGFSPGACPASLVKLPAESLGQYISDLVASHPLTFQRLHENWRAYAQDTLSKAIELADRQAGDGR